FSSIEELAKQIDQDFSNEEDKTRAVYSWIANNVEYDFKLAKTKNKRIRISYESEEERKQKEYDIMYEDANSTLKRRKAVCEGYSSLFKILCDLNDIECVKVQGFSKLSPRYIGKIPKVPDHTWNAVKINGEWKLVDVTWGAGHKDDQSGKFVKQFTDIFFFTDPDDFVLNHYPLDKKWLLTDKSIEEFSNYPFVYDYYFTSDVKLKNPPEGLLQMKSDRTVSLEIEGENIGELEYTTNSGRTYLKAKPTIINGLSNYQFKVSGSYLEIFINNNGWATFKIER
ncbi:MAG: hypothetical protein C0598_05480, partial [Marinilabiliales bacterium]